MAARPYIHRINAGGNFCGHQPDNPRIALMEPIKQGKGGIPGVLLELMRRCVDYYVSPWKIPSLNLANGSDRQQRSERREACLSLLWAILKFTDLVTLKVGVPTPDGGFLNLTVRYLARQTGLKQRRVERALADLQQAGLISVHPRCEKRPDGSYKGHAAIKAVSKLLFSIFGLQFRLGFERKRAAKRLEKKRRQQRAKASNRTAAARRNLTARAALDKAGSAIQTLNKNQPPKDDQRELALEEERQRQLQELMYRAKMANPSLSPSECREVAEKAIAARWQ